MLGEIAGALAGSALGGLMDDSLSKGRTEWNKEQTLDQYKKAPKAQVQGLVDAGLNPMLAYSNVQFHPVSAGALGRTDLAQDYSSITTANAAADYMEAQTKTEGFRAKVMQNEAIKGNYAVMQLAGTLDAAMKVTRSSNSAEAFAALAEPQVRAGLEELRAAFASAKNDADVYEALNSRAVKLALEVLGRVTGTGSAISGAVDRYRARSQRGSIIDLNKE